jgi:hypothetical protein
MNIDLWEEQVSVLIRTIVANCEPLIFDLEEAAQDIYNHSLKLKVEVCRCDNFHFFSLSRWRTSTAF